MLAKFLQFIFSRQSLEASSVWVIFGIIYAMITPPFGQGLARGIFIGACIVCFIALVRWIGAFTQYMLDRRRGKKMKDDNYLKNITNNYHNVQNPWIPAGFLLLMLSGILFLIFH
ncbi:MAG: hypothetical protein IKS37_04145 [Solobacterium sp.]|jgi:hypothetical protein|nr:hypothetical protein [Solobacterium sp.]